MAEPKVKLGVDDKVLDLLSLGNVSRITRSPIKTFKRRRVAGGEVLLAEQEPSETVYLLEGYLSENVEDTLQTLLSLYRSQTPLWLETSSFTAPVEILGIELPQGAEPYTRYRLELVEIPFWGRTLISQGENCYLADLKLAYKKRQILSPLWGSHNFQLDRTNKKFSYEFILVNELEETGNFNCLWDDDQTSFWYAWIGGTNGNLASITISDVTSPVKRGSNALKIKVTEGGSYDTWALRHDFSPAVDWSSYDFVAFWWYGKNTGKSLRFEVRTPDTANRAKWTFYDNWIGWRRLVFPLRNPTSVDGTYDLTNIASVLIHANEWNVSGTWYLDRGGVDVGNWVKVEVQVPDSLSLADSPNLVIYMFDPNTSSYKGAFGFNVYTTGWGSKGEWSNESETYLLSGDTFYNIYGWGRYINAYRQASRGETADQLPYANTGEPPATITYSQTYGCQKRIGFAVKMPPWTGCSDLTSRFAINKLRLKMEIRYAREETSFQG